MLLITYYAQNYASIICQGLSAIRSGNLVPRLPPPTGNECAKCSFRAFISGGRREPGDEVTDLAHGQDGGYADRHAKIIT